MDLLQFMRQRRSTSSRLLTEPGPDSGQLRQLLQAAVRVPDHGRLTPWRFIAVRGEQRHRLGEALARRSLERDPQSLPSVVEKDRARFSHAPLVLVVVARLTPGHKVPEQEQLLSGGALCLSLLQSAEALGFGAQWLTGWAAYDPEVCRALGLAGNEKVLGFIHIGSVGERGPERERPDPETLLTELSL